MERLTSGEAPGLALTSVVDNDRGDRATDRDLRQGRILRQPFLPCVRARGLSVGFAMAQFVFAFIYCGNSVTSRGKV